MPFLSNCESHSPLCTRRAKSSYVKEFLPRYATKCEEEWYGSGRKSQACFRDPGDVSPHT